MTALVLKPSYIILSGLLLIVAALSFVERPLLLQTEQGSIARLEVANSGAELAKGLSYRTEMNRADGMLFILPELSDSCFWMKDMHFPLDIIWVDEQHKVVKVEANLSPSTYPHSYCPGVATPYVIELNAGQTKRNNISVGSPLNW